MQVCINVPDIVYQNAFTGETSNISSMTLYTPSGPGLFRITATIYTVGNPSSTVSVTGQVSGAAGDSPCSFDGNDTSSQFSTAGTSVFSGFSGVPFVLSTTVTVSAGSLNHYDVYVTIEQVQ